MLKLDLRRPTLVVTGAINAAIFQPGWVARHLFGKPEGTNVEVRQMVMLEQPARRPFYIEGVGVNATSQRLEFYVNALSEETKQLCEAVCKLVFEKLPHTPYDAFGVNYYFHTAEIREALAAKLESSDAIGTHVTLKEQRFTAAIDYAPDIDLNFIRVISGSGVGFDFNYHHRGINIGNYSARIDGCIDKYLKASLDLLNNIYGLAEYEPEAHDFQKPQKAA